MSVFIAPGPPSRWDRIVERYRRWRWRNYGGISPRWRDIGMTELK